jgi:hypothetical protein
VQQCVVLEQDVSYYRKFGQFALVTNQNEVVHCASSLTNVTYVQLDDTVSFLDFFRNFTYLRNRKVKTWTT